MSIFYLIFIIITAYFSFRYDGIEEYDAYKQHRLWLMCIYMILLSGFSYGLGGDKFIYMEEFERYPNTFSEAGNYIWLQFMLSGQMPLWTLINMVAKSVFHSFYALQLIESAAINIAVCYVASKYTHRYFLFLLIYFFSLQYFVFNTEIMREGLALSFALVGMHGYLSGRKWQFFLLVPIGVLFHVSAVIALLLPFAKLRISWTTLGIAFFTSFFIWVLSDVALSKVMMAVLGGMGALVEKIMFYSIQASTLFGFLRSCITYLVFPFIMIYSVLSYETSEEVKQNKTRLASFVIILAVAASSFAGFTRVFNYAQVFYLIFFADFVFISFRQKEHLILRFGTLACTVFFIFSTYRIHYKSTNKYFYEFYYPYTCILDEDKSVFIREITHYESAGIEGSDKNVRNLE